MIALALDSGGRIGELLALLWEDIDLDRGEVYFRKSLQTGKGKNRGTYTAKIPKTPKSRRRVPISISTVNYLRELKNGNIVPARLCSSGGKKVQPRPEVPGLVFPDLVTGGYWNQNTLRGSVWARLRDLAGLPVTARIHDLRHTTATLLLLANINPKVVSERLGHTSIKITLDTYSHLLPGMQQSAVTALEAALYPVAVPVAVK